MHTRRVHSRFTVATPAVIWVIGGYQNRQEGSISNLSEGGLQLRLPSPVSLGEAVQVDIQGDVVIGVVRYSEPDKSEWLVGLELHNWIAKKRLEELVRVWGPPEYLQDALNGMQRRTIPGLNPALLARSVDRRETESDRD